MKKLTLLMLLSIGMLTVNAQIDNCQDACKNKPLQTYSKTISYPDFGPKPGDNIQYTFTYKECNGVLYMQSMTWTATYNGGSGAYNVNGYDRVSDILALVWHNLPNIQTVAFPASCFNMQRSRGTNILAEGINSGSDYTNVGYCDPGCCLFNKGEFPDLSNAWDPASCSTGCIPFCRQ